MSTPTAQTMLNLANNAMSTITRLLPINTQTHPRPMFYTLVQSDPLSPTHGLLQPQNTSTHQAQAQNQHPTQEQYQAVEIDPENRIIRITYTEEAIRQTINTRKCPVPTCGKWMNRKGDFEKHVGSHYEGKKMEQEYHCPVSGCYAHYRYTGSEKTHFATTKYVKQHYVKRHTAKVYSCNKCKANRYPTLPLLRQHQRFCKKSEKCSTCDKKFKIHQLRKHSLETGHKFEKEKIDGLLGEAYLATPKPRTQIIQLPTTSLQLPQQILPKVILALHACPTLIRPPSIPHVDVGTQTEHQSRGTSPSKRNSSSIRTSHCQTERLISVNTGTLTVDLNYIGLENVNDMVLARTTGDLNSSIKKPKPKRKKHHEAQTYNITKRRRSSLKKLEVQSAQTQTRPGSNPEISWTSPTMAELFQEEWECAETSGPGGITLFDEFTGLSEVETQTEDLLSTNDPLLANLGSDDIGNYLETMDSETQTFLLDTFR